MFQSGLTLPFSFIPRKGTEFPSLGLYLLMSFRGGVEDTGQKDLSRGRWGSGKNRRKKGIMYILKIESKQRTIKNKQRR